VGTMRAPSIPYEGYISVVSLGKGPAISSGEAKSVRQRARYGPLLLLRNEPLFLVLDC
jgi:hypothetical protein